MITQIQPLNLSLLNGVNKVDSSSNPSELKSGNEIFSAMLDSAKELISNVNAQETETSQLTNDFITGKNDNVHNLMIAQEKSSILLQYTMQVRNTVLESYKEIMRISV